jgi:lysophospholipase L1-like esterase
MGGYAMRTAQHLGVDLINLGFGGGAHCEREMADYIAARGDWDFATLELGINMVSWMETPVFAERVAYFIPTIAEAHPDAWIFCIDMFPFYMDFEPESERNHAYRAVVREVVEDLAYPKVLHLDGRDLLRNTAGLAADVLHPAPSGMEEIATNLATRIQRTMSSGTVKPTGLTGKVSGTTMTGVRPTGGSS